jgi:hypothetical protein
MEIKQTWKFSRKNSKGESKFVRSTNEPIEDVTKYLNEIKNITNIQVNKSPAFIIFITNQGYKVQYFWTSGRWAKMYSGAGLPQKHYHSTGIKDLFERFLDKDEPSKQYLSVNSIEVVDINFEFPGYE